MDRPTLNRIAVPLALAAILLSLASALPLGQRAPALLGFAGFTLLVAALHVVRPSREERDRPDPASNFLGTVSAALVGLLGVLIVAAVMARFGDVTYLGEAPLFLAENFTLITGPFTAVLALGPLLAARGRLTLQRETTPVRRVASLLVHGITLLVVLLMGLGVFAEPWQAPYLLAMIGALAWLDSVQIVGLPSPGAVARWLERGETAQSRALLRGLATAGNGGVIILALAGAALYVVGLPTVGVAVEVIAVLLLLAATYAASTLRSALPVELEEDPSLAKERQETLRLLTLGPLFVSVAGGLLTTIAFLGLSGGAMALAAVAELARPAFGALIAVLAGINLARARIRSRGEISPVRRAVWIAAASMMAGAGFFSVTVHAQIMTGPIVEAGIGLFFDYATLFGASLFVLARGLYPLPWSELKKEDSPDRKKTPEDYKDSLQRSMLTVYIASTVFVLGAVGLLAGVILGGLDLPVMPETAAGRNLAFFSLVALGILLILGLAALYFQSRRLEAPPQEKLKFKKRQTPHEVARLATLGISGTVALVLTMLGILVFMGQLDAIGSLTLEKKHSTDFFVFAILIGMGPAGFLYNRERKRITAIDAQLPEFLRDLAESQRTGMTLTQAVITSSRGNYGALTPEVRKMAAQIEWGVSFEAALSRFANRVDTPLVQRTVRLIIEAQNSGGNVIDVLTAASDDAREIQMIDTERKNGMQIYVMIIYIAFLVFLGVIGILNVKFMPEVAKAVSGASGVTVGSITFAEFDIQAFRTLFFHAAVIQGLGGGFVAGAMEEGKPVAGLKHAFAMVIIAYIAFRFFLGG